jgi:hypothetical protein
MKNLTCKITLYAARMIETEWLSLRTALETNFEDLGLCQCPILYQFGLPCKHVLLRAFQTGEPIPLSVVHPRYWLKGPSIPPRNWQPRYPESQPINYLETIPPAISNASAEIAALREQLGQEERSRYDAQLERGYQQLAGLARGHLQLQALPIGMPDPVPKPIGRRKKIHGTSERLETGAEAARRQQLAAERAARKAEKEKKKIKAQAINEEIEEGVRLVENTGVVDLMQPEVPPPTTPPHRKRTFTLVERTPEKPPTPARAPPPRPTSPEGLEPPPSTAPPVLTRYSGRERKRTERFVTARKEGFLPESQPRE